MFGSRDRGNARSDSDLDLLLIVEGSLTSAREKRLRRRVRNLLLPLRHEQSLAASLDPSFVQENWGFPAQQGVEHLLKGLIVLADQPPPLRHDLARLQQLAGARVPEQLLERCLSLRPARDQGWPHR
ncbi:MAG: nucleotidyltransferase domain-containing protein [Cyanobacteriota bacterium]